MYIALRALKFSGGPSAFASSVVLVGDNYSENKNTTNLAFASELVLRGWYDEVFLLFPIVGHTHNGTDATHNSHNNGVRR
jgi:hypothetical protein